MEEKVNQPREEREAQMDVEQVRDGQGKAGEHRVDDVQRERHEHESELQRLGHPGEERGERSRRQNADSELPFVATGGGTRVEPWMQAIADATGHPVEVSGVPEGAALGAAFLGRMAAGLESSIADAARWASIERVVEPDLAWQDPMEERYGRFLELAGDE